jgi:5-methylcytosine-specific restriction endonuclease McrA
MGKDKRTYKDRREYLINAVHARRKKIRAMAIEYKGGKCERCSYDRCKDALEFHHINPIQKDFIFPARVTPEAGIKSKKSWINA